MVAIKDFGMPSCCAECNLEFVHDDILGCCVYQGFDDENKDRYDKRLPNCPLVDIKERKVGKWINGHCSICGCDVPAYIIDWKWKEDMKADYCPKCGSEMEGSIETSDNTAP